LTRALPVDGRAQSHQIWATSQAMVEIDDWLKEDEEEEKAKRK